MTDRAALLIVVAVVGALVFSLLGRLIADTLPTNCLVVGGSTTFCVPGTQLKGSEAKL